MSGLTAALRARQSVATRSGDLLVGHLDSVETWHQLEPYWEAIHTQTPNAGVFQSLPYLTAWWEHLGSNGQLLVIVAMREGIPVAIAPLQITPVKQLGSLVPTISFIGQPSESDRPTLLGMPDAEVAAAIVDHLFAVRGRWRSIVLFEQPPESPLVSALAARLATEGYRRAEIAGNQCPYVDLTGSWTAYLAGRTKAFRKSVKRRRHQLESKGVLQFEQLGLADGESVLQRYREVEKRSWKPAQNLGIASSPRHWAFYCDLTRRDGPSQWLRFAFLKLDGKDIAATFGLLWRRRFYSLHVAHDAAYAEYSPGVVMTAMELERFFELEDCDRYEFLGGFLSNKRGWASGTPHTTALFGDRPSVRARLFHLVYFRIKPWTRRFLARVGALDYVTQKLHRYLKNRKPRADE